MDIIVTTYTAILFYTSVKKEFQQVGRHRQKGCSIREKHQEPQAAIVTFSK
jgi:hypothetical protein